MSDSKVAVTLTPLGENFPLQRKFVLSDSNRSLVIGRSSKREQKHRSPAPDNGWYDSRVMSRDHAELFIGPDSKTLKIDDLNSTHGTWLNNTRLVDGEAAELRNGDVVRFGVDVENGQESFPALVVRCKLDWSGEVNPSEIDIENVDGWQPTVDSNPLPSLRSVPFTNTFRVPESDSDVEEITTTFGWAPQKPEASSSPDQKNMSHFPTPISSEIHDLKDPCNELGGPTGYADPIKPNINKSMEPAPKVALTKPIEVEPFMGLDEHEEFDREMSVSFDEYDDNAGFEIEEVDRDIEEIEHDIADILDASDLDDESNDDEFDSEDLSNASGSYSEDESSSVDNESDQDYVNPTGMLISSKAVPISRVSATEDPFKETLSLQKENAARQERIPEAIPGPSRPIVNASSSYTRCTIPSLLNCPPAHSLNEGGMARTCDPMDVLHMFPDSKPSFSYDDGPFAFDSLPAKEIKNERSTPLTPMTQLPGKRKASEMELEDAQLLTTNPVSSQTLNASSNEQNEAATAISSALSEAEPPSKRAKSSRSSSSNVASYTATAIVSALLGGLGTIALLAALPAEYFQ